jgi:hypothetical protein
MNPEEIRAKVDAMASRVLPDGRINTQHVAIEQTLRQRNALPSYIAELDGPGKFRPTWDYTTHPGDCHPRQADGVWTTCCPECAGTGVFPVPWISSPAEGRDDPDASCVACKASGRAVVGLAGSPTPETERMDRCRCKHSVASHDAWGQGPCAAIDCGCHEFAAAYRTNPSSEETHRGH